LNVSGNAFLADFTPITYLAALNAIALNGCGLDEIPRLPAALTSVELDDNFIQNLAPLTEITGLNYLWAERNQLREIDPLAGLTNLAEVYLQSNFLDTNSTSTAWAVISTLIGRAVYVKYDPQNPVFDPPVITTQPVRVVAFPGDNITFNVVAIGNGSGLNYRWQKDGANLENAPEIGGTDGDTLYVDNLQAGDVGSYRVRVWDDKGVTYSFAATLRLVTNVAFIDPKLELAVRARLGIPTAPLTPADLAPMTWLNAHDYGITNLSGLESAANLDSLSLSYNPGIGDYTPLIQLPKLFFLNLNACGSTDISFVAALAPLAELHLWNWSIEDISPLAAQPQLVRLNLAYSAGITNREILNGLTQLEAFWFEGGGSTDISFVTNMPNLREFSFENSTVSDLTPLTGATNLVWLDLANNQITNAAPLAGCTNLDWLSAGGNQLGNLDFAARFTKLTVLGVNHSAVTNISGITGLTNLLNLDVGWNPIATPAPLGTLTRLTDLHIWSVGLSNNLGFLATLTNLAVFNAGMNQITTLPPYPNLNRLRHLNLDQNPLSTLAFASGMTNLTELYISGTGLRDLTPLTGCTNLHNLGLTDNGITDLTPLATLQNLRWVTLWNNHVQTLSALAGLTNLTYADLRQNLLDAFGPNTTLTTIQTLQTRGVNVEYDPQQPGAIFLLSPERTSGQFQFTLHSAPGIILEILSSTNLTDWTSAGWVTNTTGVTPFADPAASAERGFYRVQRQ
jgi:internalin A